MGGCVGRVEEGLQVCGTLGEQEVSPPGWCWRAWHITRVRTARACAPCPALPFAVCCWPDLARPASAPLPLPLLCRALTQSDQEGDEESPLTQHGLSL